MAEDMKSRGDRILKNIINGLASSAVTGDDNSGAKDLVFNLLSKAGKGKDEFVQVLGREIGLALAAVLAKPLAHITENKRVRVTIELVPKAPKKQKRKARTTK